MTDDSQAPHQGRTPELKKYKYVAIRHWNELCGHDRNGNLIKRWVKDPTTKDVDDPAYNKLGLVERYFYDAFVRLRARTGRNIPVDEAWINRALGVNTSQRRFVFTVLPRLIHAHLLVLTNQEVGFTDSDSDTDSDSNTDTDKQVRPFASSDLADVLDEQELDGLGVGTSENMHAKVLPSPEVTALCNLFAQTLGVKAHTGDEDGAQKIIALLTTEKAHKVVRWVGTKPFWIRKTPSLSKLHDHLQSDSPNSLLEQYERDGKAEQAGAAKLNPNSDLPQYRRDSGKVDWQKLYSND